MSTHVELLKMQLERDNYRARTIHLEARCQELEAEVARLKTPLPVCATCDGEGVTFPPAIFGEAVPDSAGEECSDCFGTGRDRHPA
jgi:DnaJ-class molecular chaperone